MLAYILALAVGFFSLAIYMAAFFFPEVHRKGDFIWSGVGLFYALVLWVCSGRITGGVLLGQVASVALLGWSVTQTLSLRRQLTPRLSQTVAPSAEEVKSNVQEKVAKSSFFSKLSQLTKRGDNSAATAKERLQQLSEQTPPVAEPVASATTTASTTPATNNNTTSVQIIDSRTSKPEQPEEAATQQNNLIESIPNEASPEATIADEVAQGASESTSNISEDTASDSVADATPTELVRPNPPEPELVEAALKDAEEKHQEAAPPDPETPENPSPS